MKWSSANTFIFCLLSFVFGIGVAGFFSDQIVYYAPYIFIVSLLLFIIAFVFWKKIIIRIVALLAFFLFLGIWRFSVSIPVSSADKIWYYNDMMVTVSGQLCEEPDLRSTNQKLTICATKIKNKDPLPSSLHSAIAQDRLLPKGRSKVEGRILVTTDLYPSYEYGDELEFECLLEAPEAFEDFAYDRYLARYDIYSVCFYPKKIQVSEDIPVSLSALFKREIIKFRSKIQDIINIGLPEPEAGLANAMTLGYKSAVGDDLRNSFSATGLSHIMAISGLHIGIIGIGLFNVLMFFCIRRPIAFWFSVFIIFIYIIMIGAPASAVRAGIMGGLMLFALNIGRLGSSWRVLVVAAAVLLAFNPKLLASDVGFQLSFLAVLGIILLYPRFKKFVDSKIRIRYRILEIICDLFLVSLAAQIFTLPIVAVNFGIISLVSPVANLFVLPLLPILMITVIGAIIGTIIFLPMAWFFFTPAYFVLHYVVWIVDLMAELPFASLIF